MTELELRQGYALCAAKYCGAKEGEGEHEAIRALYNSLNPLPRGHRLTKTDAWCAGFVSAVAVETGLTELFPVECSCSQMLEKAKNMGIWVEDDAHVPQTGELVLYNWQADGTGDDRGAPDHVGVVVARAGQTVYVMEGNYQDAVRRRVIRVDHPQVRGYICPDYAAKAEEEAMLYHTIAQVPVWGKATIEKLTADGSLKGVAGDDLGLTEDLLRTLVILDRRGLL